MANLLFQLASSPSLPVRDETSRYPVGRIFCVGRNYAAHAAEMGVTVDREAPFYFTKSPTAAQPSGTTVTYPPGTDNFHYEMELVVALGSPGFQIKAEDAPAIIYGYGCGLDMTRRDLQLEARAKKRPWDLGKDVEQSAVFAQLTKAADMPALGPQRIHLSVDGEIKQEAHLFDLIHKVPEIIADLSHYYHLVPGDLIMTGTPAGVGPVTPGANIVGGIDGLDPIELTIGAPE